VVLDFIIFIVYYQYVEITIVLLGNF